MTEKKNYYINPVHKPLPVGYLFSPNVLNLLLPRVWGDRIDLAPMSLFGFDVGAKTALGDIERAGQIDIASRCILEALRSQALECRTQNENDGLEVISFDLWGDAPDKYACELIESGVVFGFWVDGFDWADGRALLFEEAQVNEWLSGFVSDHVLPCPLKRPADTLPDRIHVSLCELVTWLSDNKPISSETASEEYREKFERMKEGADAKSVEENFSAQECLDFQFFLAMEAARETRWKSVVDEVTLKITTGEISAFGRLNTGGKNLNELSKIPTEALLGNLGLRALLDSIEADGAGSYDDYKAARKLSYTGVRFRLEDVISVWGQEAVSGNALSQTIPSAAVKAAVQPRFSQAAFERAYKERVDTWPNGSQHPTREDDEQWARDNFGCGREAARTARKKYAGHWANPGRPPIQQ